MLPLIAQLCPNVAHDTPLQTISSTIALAYIYEGMKERIRSVTDAMTALAAFDGPSVCAGTHRDERIKVKTTILRSILYVACF